MVYWVEYEKQRGIRERAGETADSARKNAIFILSGGMYGSYARIYDGQIYKGTCKYSFKTGKSTYKSRSGKVYPLNKNGTIVTKSKVPAPFGL